MKSILPGFLTGSLLLSAAMAGETGPSTGAVAKDVPLGHNVAEPLPYGHKDFVPTPERPVYFRQTYGNYPGATPPLEWWDGTPTTRKVGNKAIPDFADRKSKNILWKAPVPGWSLSHPIVVGKRVFAVGDMDFVTCWDLDTGKQLWQRRIMPLLCDGLSEEKAVAGQKVLDLARAFEIITGGYCNQPGNLFLGLGRDGAPLNPDHAAFVAEKKAMAQKYLDAFTPHRPEVEAFGNAALLAALDKDLEILRRYQAVTDLESFKSVLQSVGGKGLRPTNLVKACLDVLQVDLSTTWLGYVSNADSTLASDGQRIYGVFDQGQVFALDLDGKTVWLQREKGQRDNRGTFHRSPLLCGDPAGSGTGLLLVRSIHRDRGKNVRPLRALDVKTGQVRWEAPLAPSNYTVPRLMRLPGADGKPVDVLISDAPQSKVEGFAVVQVRDGKALGYLPPYSDNDDYDTRGALLAVFDQQVTGCARYTRNPSFSYRLRLEGADTVVAEKVFRKKNVFAQLEFPTVAGTTWMCPGDSRGSYLYDGTTGARISRVRVGNSFGVVAGHYLITLSGGKNESGYPSGTVTQPDGASGMFAVIDIKNPAQPVVMARNNLLGYKEPAADLIVSTYFKDFDPFDFTGCDRGAARYFMQMGGPVPAGDKLLIQSTKYLYCIGPAIQGVPGDNPATVQAIRAAKPAELATYLASPSALYRHTAVTAMITAGIGGAKEAVTRLVKEDPYEEIRAAAVLALNAAEPEAAPGTQALLPLMTAAWIGGRDGGGFQMNFDRRAIQRALEVLGKERGTALLVAAFTKTQDEPTRQSLIDFAAVMGWAAPEFTRQAQAYLAPRSRNRVLAARYLAGSGLITTDKEVRETVKREYRQLVGGPKSGVEKLLPILAFPLGQVLEGEEKIAFLLHGLRFFSRTHDRTLFLCQLQAMGRAAGSAIPELEKMVAAANAANNKPLAREIASVIEAIKGK